MTKQSSTGDVERMSAADVSSENNSLEIYMMVKMTRRKFLVSVTLMSTLTWLSGTSCFASMWRLRKTGGSARELKESILGIFSNLDTPRIIGNRYLELYPHAVSHAIFLSKRIQSLPNRTTHEIKNFLAQERKADFVNNEIVILDGWVLSRAEVAVCVLTVLL